jgi:hypothetical protein
MVSYGIFSHFILINSFFMFFFLPVKSPDNHIANECDCPTSTYWNTGTLKCGNQKHKYLYEFIVVFINLNCLKKIELLLKSHVHLIFIANMESVLLA